ncbi:MAG: GumC family protein [Planctomycetaceae bacterium]|nr:GumC family protein [Planctomycetaceae bacterium]
MMIKRATSPEGHHASGRHSQNVPREALRILFRHKGKMLATFGVIMGLVIAALAFFPRTYSSDARLFVRLGRESIGLDPTATIHSTVNVEGSRETEINSELEILRSRVLLQDVVDRLGADVVLGRKPLHATGHEEESGPSFLTNALDSVLSTASSWMNGKIPLKERAVTALEKNIKVATPRRSNVLLVRADADSPELAHRILQAYLEAYHLRHATANRISGSYEFFVTQSNMMREELDAATKALRDAKNAEQLVSVEGQRAVVQEEMNSIETAMLANQRELASAEARIESLSKALTDLPAVLDEEADGPSEAANSMRTELYRVQILENEASSRLTPQHPTVVALRRQLAEAKKIYDDQPARANSVTHRLNTVQQAAQTELVTAQALAAACRAEAKSLAEQYKAVQSKIQRVNDNEQHIAELTRKAELLETSYRTYDRNREQARIDQALEIGRISNVNVIQPPTLIEKPSSPRGRLVLAMGTILAIAGSVLVAMAAEYFDPSLKTVQQIEEQLGMPVLFSVPREGSQELIRN